jgi:leucyl-tRNA synthetase
MELVNHTRKAIDQGPGGQDPAVREAVEAVAIGLSMFAPYTAEEMWERLGHEPSVALTVWPEADTTLIVEESVTAIVQVNGKVRARLEVSPQISEVELRTQALADPQVAALVGGKEIATLVVRPPKVVSIQLA